ncbi:MAG: hypothetical protein K6E19_05760 [Lachnospiraceae bacterium]|nr:hypothetical protein [Lachnospiraceae bacterium]
MRLFVAIMSVVMILTQVNLSDKIIDSKAIFENMNISESVQPVVIREINTLLGLMSTSKRIIVEYQGPVTEPPQTYYYEAVKYGIRYGGTLNLDSFHYDTKKNITYVYYSGTIDRLD